MKFSSRLLLEVAKCLPRGYWRIIRFAAFRDESLQDLPIGLRNTRRSLRADLRESVFVPLYRNGCIPHQIGFDRICGQILRGGDLVFDVGANIGYTAALFSDIVGKHGRVVAVEPSPRSYFLLSRSLFGVPNIDLLNAGISAKDGELTFYIPAALDRASFEPIPGASTRTVKVTTLDSMAESFGQPTFIKVDVEGHEPDVFAGAGKTLEKDDRPIIIFEALNLGMLERCRAILIDLSAGDYRFMRVLNNGLLISADNGSGSSDYLAIPSWAEDRLSARHKIVYGLA